MEVVGVLIALGTWEQVKVEREDLAFVDSSISFIYVCLFVLADSSQASRTGGCFSGNSTVETPSGTKRMEEIKAGDKILTIDSDGKEVFSDVLLFLDRNTTEVREFFELTTESGAKLTLTPSHLLYSIQPEGVTPDDEFLLSKNRYLRPEEISNYFLAQAEITFAKFVQPGDWVLVKQDQRQRGEHELASSGPLKNLHTYSVEKVINIEAKIETGVYAPLTSTGNLVVDGVLSSCYALIDDQTLAHVAFAPVRIAHNFRQSVAYLWRQISRFVSFIHHEEPEEHGGNHYATSTSTATSASVDNHLSAAAGEENQEQHKLTEFNKPGKTPTTAKWESRSSGSGAAEEQQGIHWYASFLYSATKYVLPASILYDQ